MKTAIAATAAIFLMTGTASATIVCNDRGCSNTQISKQVNNRAKVAKYTRPHRYVRNYVRPNLTQRTQVSVQSVSTEAHPQQIVAHPAGCPRSLFCGCGTAVHIFGSPIRSLWLAANWLKFPRAAPGPGMVAARHGHVFAIEKDLGNGMVLAYDPNSGRGLTRIHVVSLRGYSVVNPHGGGEKYARLR